LKALIDLLIEAGDARQAAKHSILEFEGSAAHLANDEDPQAYLERMRGMG
jgi:hypothetical protein